MFKCKYCDGSNELKTFVPFKETRRQWAGDAKYTFHIKSVCGDCKKFQKFLKQDEALMEELRDSVLVKPQTSII
jgi:hypothetical protein